MKKKIILLTIEFIISILAILAILKWFDIKLLVVLFLWTTANNLMLRRNK